MHEYACKKEFIIRLAEIKQAKRQCNVWISFMTGVVSKIKQVLQIQALTQDDYFRNAYDKVNQMFENFLKRYTEITDDYNRIKRIVLDYNYQFGRLKAL